MDTIRVESTGAVTRVTLDRPDVRNAFNDSVVLELTEAFENLPDTTRVVVLSGEGKAFCAGADLTWMKKSATYTREQNVDDAGSMVRLFDAVNRCSRPVVGRVNGTALGGGVGLVSCCDIVVASQKAKFGFTEVRLGLIPAVISPYVIDRIGAARARRLFVTGEIFDADQACRIGLVDEVVSLESLDDRVNALVEMILQNGPVAVTEAKNLVLEVTARERDSALSFAVNKIAELRVSQEGQEGLAAFLEKREPGWR